MSFKKLVFERLREINSGETSAREELVIHNLLESTRLLQKTNLTLNASTYLGKNVVYIRSNLTPAVDITWRLKLEENSIPERGSRNHSKTNLRAHRLLKIYDHFHEINSHIWMEDSFFWDGIKTVFIMVRVGKSVEAYEVKSR